VREEFACAVTPAFHIRCPIWLGCQGRGLSKVEP
jgi:hypothetical protein